MNKSLISSLFLFIGLIIYSCEPTENNPLEDNKPPTIGSFTVNPSIGKVGSEFTFSCSASDKESPELTYNIDFDGGGIDLITNSNASTFNCSHIYPTAGYYTATALVKDEAGRSCEAYVYVTVEDTANTGNENPILAYASPGNGAQGVGLNTSLVWTCTDPNSDPVKFNVYFGTTNPPLMIAEAITGTAYSPLLEAGMTYYWKIDATDDKGGFATGPVWSFGTGNNTDCGTVSYGGVYYYTLKIGNQCWFQKNLDYGSKIPGNIDQSDNGIVEKYCYNDLQENCNIYGGLYQWNELTKYSGGANDLCPEGWNVPTFQQWEILIDFLGGSGVAGGRLKNVITGWDPPNTGATNDFTFSALGGGYRNFDALFANISKQAVFATITPHPFNNTCYSYILFYDDASIFQGASDYSYGLSVRCMKNVK